jgi:gliding motility-associated-like protein
MLRLLSSVIFFITLISNIVHSQNFTTKGKIFWMGFMENYSTPTLTVYISSDVATTGTISIPAQGWTQNFNVAPGATTPVQVPAAQAQATGSGTIQPRGIRIVANDSVNVFALNFVPYTSDAAVILPIQTIGNSYYASAYKDNQAPYSGVSEILIVGCYPNTIVEITPKAATTSGNPANVPFQITINPGQVYQLQSNADLSGTLVRGIDNGNGCPNFAFYAGNVCTGVQCAYCDHLYEQMYPVSTWGTKYILPPLRTRTNDRYRIIASANATQLTINGGATINLNAGQVHQFDTGTPSYVSSNNPIQVSQYSKGSSCDNTSSDPFMIMLSPIEQTLKYVTFNAFTSTVITNYYLNVVTKTANKNLMRLDGANIGAQFVNVAANPVYCYAQLNITQGNHTLQSDSGFVAYVYGYGQDESYGYPVGANLTNLFAGFTYSPADSTLDTTYLCPNTLLRFTGRGDTTVSTYEWDFGDGGTGTGRSIFHSYQNFGTYEVKMMITRPNACGKDTLKNIVKVLGPRPNLVSDDTLCRGVPFTITAANALRYFWSNGATTPSITVSPTTTTTYWVQIQDTQCMGAPDSVTLFVSNPVPDFSFTEVCEGTSVTFVNNSTTDLDTVTSWSWNFGDNNTSNVKNPTHTYSSGGNYNVTLTMNTSLGCTETLTKPLVNHPFPVAAFTASNVCEGKNAVFTDNSTITIDNISLWSWAFGDGNFSQLQSPVHLYADTGAYNVQLIVNSSFGCADTTSNTVVVYLSPVAAFTTQNECMGVDLQFQNNSSSGAGISYDWNFGDNNISNIQSPSHSYNTDGNYNTQLIVTTVNGCADTASQQVTVYPLPQSSFTFQNVCDGVTMNFNNTSNIASGTFGSNWDFGDGNTVNQQSPSHLYADSGSYTVKLVLTSGFNCTDSISQNVRVYFQPVADFMLQNVCFGTAVDFADNSYVSPDITYNWNFDDGTSGNTANPSHPYSTADSFNVELLVTTAYGCKDSITKLAVVYPQPRPQFSAQDVCFGVPTVFNNQSTIQSGSIQQHDWDFGDGDISNQQNPSHLYANTGTYQIELKLTSDLGCTDSLQKTFTVFPLPTATSSSTIACYDENNASAIVYPFAGTPPYTVLWSDGQTTETAAYLYAGNYDVTVSDANNCTVTISETVIEQPFPVILQTNFAIDSIMFGDTIKVVSVTGNYDPYLTYVWQPSTGLGCDTCQNTFAAPLQTTVYTINAVDTMGCRGATGFEVVVLFEYIIYIPNAFSPNANGVNDIFRVYSKGVKNITLQVFDRWGEKIFESAQLADGWDGFYRGKEMAPSVYVYVAHLEFLNGYKTIKKGSVTLIK